MSKNNIEFYEREITVSGNYVENEFNGGGFARIGDSLYYSCYSTKSAGLIKISESGAKMIYEYGKSFKGVSSEGLCIKNGDIYRIDSYSIEKFNPVSGKFSHVLTLEADSDIIIEMQVVNNVIYFLAGEELYSTNSSTAILKNISEYWVDVEKNKIWFSRFNDDKGSHNELYIYDCNTKKEYLLAEFDSYLEIRGDNSNGVFIATFDSSDWSFEAYTVTDSGDVNRIYKGEPDTYYDIHMNAYDDCAYLCYTNGGIYSVDFSGNVTQLCNDKAELVYIVDDTWVYFRTPNESLMRVPRFGGYVEEVYVIS